MADMLKFRKGTYAQINAAPKAAGTIYIAKDEKAMYVDVDASTRIRIGDFIRVASIEEIPQPYSETAVYYVEGANALLGYKDGQWKQINGTEELVTRIAAVEGDVATNKSDISTLKTDVGTLKTDVSDLKTTVGTHGTDIEALKAAVGMDDEGNVEGLAGSVAQLRTDLTTLEGTVETQGNTISEHTGKISALETESAKHALKTDLDAYAKTADIQATLEKVDTEGTVTAAINAAVAGEKSRAEAAEQALSNELAAVKNTADSAVSNATFEQFKTDNTTAINNAKTSAVSEATTAANGYTDGKIAEEVTRANGAYAPKSLVDTVAGHTGTLNTLTGEATVVGSVAEAKKAADDAAALAAQKTTMAEVEAKNYATKTEAQGYANAKDEAIQAAANAASAAQGAADAAQGDATQALADAAAAQGDATQALADAAAAKTQADKGVSDAAAAKSAADAAQDTADANAEEIATLKGKVSAIEGDYVTESELATVKSDLQAEIDADIRAANAMEYVATIESASDLPATAKNGATYVVGAAFGDYAAGDMLIAQGDEDPDTGLITNPTWAHVKSGYDASLDQKLTGADNKIKLSTGTGLAGTEVAFTATGSASVAVADNTVTIGMVWEDFGDEE